MADPYKEPSKTVVVNQAGPSVAADVEPAPAVGWAKAFVTLRNPHFRMYWLGMLAYFTAMNMGVLARGWLAWDLTGKSTALGFISLAWGAPMLLLSLFGGAIADRSDKRALILASQLAMFLVAITIAVLVHTGVIQIWHLALLALAQGTVFAFAIPARMAWVPELVSEHDLMNGIALNNAAMQATRIAGPGIAGGLVAVPFFGLTGTFYVIAFCYILVFLCMFRVPSTGISDTDRGMSMTTRMLAGVRYIAGHDLLLMLLVLALLPIMLGAPFTIMLPVFADDVYDVGSAGLGIMMSVSGVGAVTGSILIGGLGDFRRRGTVQLAAGIMFGVGLVLLGLAGRFALALVALPVIGMAMTIYMVINNTLVLTYADRKFHGRVMSVYMLTFSMMPVVALPATALADVIGVERTVIGLGAALAVLMAIARVVYPGYRRLDEMGPAPPRGPMRGPMGGPGPGPGLGP
jgi:MFS family permease